jgi:hypothetical protein
MDERVGCLVEAEHPVDDRVDRVVGQESIHRARAGRFWLGFVERELTAACPRALDGSADDAE